MGKKSLFFSAMFLKYSSFLLKCLVLVLPRDSSWYFPVAVLERKCCFPPPDYLLLTPHPQFPQWACAPLPLGTKHSPFLGQAQGPVGGHCSQALLAEVNGMTSSWRENLCVIIRGKAQMCWVTFAGRRGCQFLQVSAPPWWVPGAVWWGRCKPRQGEVGWNWAGAKSSGGRNISGKNTAIWGNRRTQQIEG